MDRLAELAASIERDPAEVAREVRVLVEAARHAEDWHSLSRAQSVLGRAWRMLGEIDLAEQVLDEAIASAQKAGDCDLEADAHLALGGVLAIAGRSADAFGHLDEVERLGSGQLRLATMLQRASLCRQFGRFDEALRLFNLAIPGLRRDTRSLDLARVLANMGIIRLALGDVAGAVTNFEEAEDLFRGTGHEFVALQVRHDLACATANLGDLPRALQMFDDVTARFVELGHDASVPLLSRAEALLLGGLNADALSFSQDAARRLHSEGNHVAAAQALVTVAEAARLEGDHTASLDAANRARRLFAASQLIGWERTAELEALSTRQEVGGLDDASVGRLVELSEALAAVDDLRGEVHARCLAAVALCARGRLDSADEQGARAVKAARRSRLVLTRLAAHHALFTCRVARGDIAAARREARLAIQTVEASSQLLGAGDAGAAIDTQARSIIEMTTRIAAHERQPLRALNWMELARAATQVSRPALPPAAAESAAEFARLRAVAGELRRAELAGQPTDELRHRRAELERSMRSEWLKAPRSPGSVAALPKLNDLKQLVGDAQVVSIASTGDSLVAVVVDRRRARSYTLATPASIASLAQQANTALRSLASVSTSPAVAVARRRTFAAAVDSLDTALLGPLQLVSRHVVLVVPADLHAIPWAAMASMQGRSFTLAPSVSWWIAAGASPPTPPASALVVAGPRLAEAEAEAGGVAACHSKATVLAGTEATVFNVGAALAHHDIAHFVAHGQFRHDNPLWSTLELADGPLTVYELERLGHVPPTVVLATCDSGIGGARSGAQLHGLASTLLTMGARTIVAAIGALPDTAETRQVMVTLHRDLVDGLSASTSLARQRTLSDGSSSLTAAGLVTLGVG